VPRSTYYRLRDREEEPGEGDLIDDAVREEFERSSRRYGARRLKKALERRGIVASRRRIRRSMRSQGLRSRYQRKSFRPHPSRPNEADLPNVLDRDFDGHAPHTHVCSDLTYVRVGSVWCYVCLLIDLYNREIVGHAASRNKDAALVMAAFATLEFPLCDIDVFHTDRGSEFDNAAIDEMLEVFGITRSLSKKGCPFDNAVDESTNKSLKAELVWGEEFRDLNELQVRLNEYVWWYNNDRLHSTLNYMSPVEFRLAGLSL
jgi:transposase InsO family protein